MSGGTSLFDFWWDRNGWVCVGGGGGVPDAVTKQKRKKRAGQAVLRLYALATKWERFSSPLIFCKLIVCLVVDAL